MIKLKDLLTEKKVYVALVMNKGAQSSMGKKQVSKYAKQGYVGGILQANADRMFKSEVGRNLSKPAADKLKVQKHWNQKGLKGSKNPTGRQRQYIDGISGEITAPNNAVEWFRDGQVIKATNRLDLVVASSSSKLDGILKSTYGMIKEGKLTETSAYKTATRNELAMYITQLSNTINGTKDRKMLQYLKSTKKEVEKELKSRKKDEGKLTEKIDMTINNWDLWKQEKSWLTYNKATDSGKTVLVVLKKDKKIHYVWQAATPNFIRATDLEGKKWFTIKPGSVYQVVQLPHSGYVNKHPELKKYGFR